LPLNGIVGDADSSGIIAIDGGGRLGVAHFFERESKICGLFAIKEEGTKFGLCSGGNNKP
jgi:hypothetical protein